MTVLYKNQAALVNFNIGIDTSLTSDIILNYKKPDGTKAVFTPIQVSVQATGDVYYELQDNELDQTGIWVFWSEVTTADGGFPGHPFTIECRDGGDNLTNKDFVKAYLQISDSAEDVIIDSMISLAEQEYLDIRNVPWDRDASGNTVYPKGSDVTIAEMIGYKLALRNNSGRGVASESIDGYSISYNDGSGNSKFGYPNTIVSAIKRFIDGR